MSQRQSTETGIRETPSLRSLLVGAVACFAAARLMSMSVAVAIVGPHAVGRRLRTWDGGYYLSIARNGYPAALPARPGHGSAIAFFPLYPYLIRATYWLVPGSVLIAAVMLSLVGGAVAAALIGVLAYRVFAPRADSITARRAAMVTVAAWSAQPASFVLSLVYSEALFTALAAGCLLALLSRHWWTAGVLALLAGATRPTGLVLAACCLVAAAYELAEQRNPAAELRGRSVRLGRALPPLAAATLAPLGVVAFIAWLGWHVHRSGAWFVAQRQGWRVYPDGGGYLIQKIAQYARHPAERPSGLAVIAVIAVAVVLSVLLIRDRPPLVLGIYAAGLVLITFTTHGAFGSIPRFLLPAFPLLLPVGIRAVRLPTALLASLFVLAAAATGIAGAWVTGQSVLPP